VGFRKERGQAEIKDNGYLGRGARGPKMVILREVNCAGDGNPPNARRWLDQKKKQNMEISRLIATLKKRSGNHQRKIQEKRVTAFKGGGLQSISSW